VSGEGSPRNQSFKRHSGSRHGGGARPQPSLHCLLAIITEDFVLSRPDLRPSRETSVLALRLLLDQFPACLRVVFSFGAYCRLYYLPGLGWCAGLHFWAMLLLCQFVPRLPSSTLLAFTIVTSHCLLLAQTSRPLLRSSARCRRVLSGAWWYAHPPLFSRRHRCAPTFAGGIFFYALGRRQPPPSPTRSRGLPLGTWGS